MDDDLSTGTDDQAAGAEDDTDAVARAAAEDVSSGSGEASAGSDAWSRYGDLADRLLRNQVQWGVIVLHYAARDVEFGCDGATAMRILAVFARHGGEELTDVVSEASEASHGWLVASTELVLAVTWHPDPKPVHSKVAFDPPQRG